MSIGTTFDSNLTRNGLVQRAYRDIGVLEQGESLDSNLLSDGVDSLNLIIREMDAQGKHLTAVGATPSTVTLKANTWSYTSSNGLPTNILALTKVTYRNPAAEDLPVTILQHQEFEEIQSKLSSGDPTHVFLSDHITIGSKTLLVYPSLSSVNTQSVVTGTDAAAYKCIRSHTSDSDNKPITGSQYLLYWESGGSGPVAWATATAYVAPQLLRLWFRKPLFDFDVAGDNPDLPLFYTRYLLYKLEEELGMAHGLSPTELAWLERKRKEAYETIFPGLIPSTTGYHNKAKYY